MKKKQKRPTARTGEPSPREIKRVAEQSLEMMTELLREEDPESSPSSAELFILAAQAGGAARLAKGLQEGRTPEDIAQEMAYDACETPDPDRAIALAMQAMTVDPDCVDAMHLVATLGSSSLESEINMLSEAVKSGERRLGRKYFKEHRGHFWGMLETRPYMRARLSLANALKENGRVSEAITHCEALLELNPNDNQGVRELLTAWYLEIDKLEGARDILRRYPNDMLAGLAWARVLERFLSGDVEGAARELARARARNQYVEDYLSGQKELHVRIFDTYAFGSSEEAVCCAAVLLPAWEKHPAAQDWLKAETAGHSRSTSA